VQDHCPLRFDWFFTTMPRPLRIDYPGAWHHVMNRGIDHQTVFTSADCHQLFFECLSEAAVRAALEVHAYCLMGNHFHLLLFSLDGRLSEGLKFLSGRFTRLVNKKSGRDGPIFRGRSHSVSAESDAHIVQASRYIHLNPIVAGLCRAPEDWQWSSAGCYLGLEHGPAWLKTDRILGMLGGLNQHRKYRELLVDEPGAKIEKFYARLEM
jgi:putative transposase